MHKRLRIRRVYSTRFPSRSLLNEGLVRVQFTVLSLGLRFLMFSLHSWIMTLPLQAEWCNLLRPRSLLRGRSLFSQWLKHLVASNVWPIKSSCLPWFLNCILQPISFGFFTTAGWAPHTRSSRVPCIHLASWNPIRIPIRTSGIVKSLGVEYSIYAHDRTSFAIAYQSPRAPFLVFACRRASASLITNVMTF